MGKQEMEYSAWLKQMPETLTQDPLWKMEVYRISLYVTDMGWVDVTQLLRDRRTRSLADQLYRALGSVGANIAEGYSKRSGLDRARFYEYALGSARESRTWYYAARHILGEAITIKRLNTLTRVIKLLLTIIPRQRASRAYEPNTPYRLTGMRLAQYGEATITQHASRNTQ